MIRFIFLIAVLNIALGVGLALALENPIFLRKGFFRLLWHTLAPGLRGKPAAEDELESPAALDEEQPAPDSITDAAPDEPKDANLAPALDPSEEMDLDPALDTPEDVEQDPALDMPEDGEREPALDAPENADLNPALDKPQEEALPS